MKLSDFVQEKLKDLNDGDTLVLESDIEFIINRCCDCGALHIIEIVRSQEEGTIRMTWNRLHGEPDIELPREAIIEAALKDMP